MTHNFSRVIFACLNSEMFLVGSQPEHLDIDNL